MASNVTNRDPIRDAPLRDPGQSLRERLEDEFFEVFVPWLAIAVLMVLMAAMEWLRWALNDGYRPQMMTVAALAGATLATWRIYRAYQRRSPGKLGLKGERSVGQFLQAALLPREYYVLHDICIDDFNVDHVVIGQTGVYAVEVKTRSKPQRGDARVTFVGEQCSSMGWRLAAIQSYRHERERSAFRKF